MNLLNHDSNLEPLNRSWPPRPQPEPDAPRSPFKVAKSSIDLVSESSHAFIKTTHEISTDFQIPFVTFWIPLRAAAMWNGAGIQRSKQESGATG